MRTKNRFISPFIAVGILLGAFAVFASAGPTDRLAEKLQLSEVQQQSLAALRTEFEAAREAAKARRQEVKALEKAGQTDAAADLAAEAARERVYQKAEMDRRLAVILTPEQLAQHDELRMSRHQANGKDRRDEQR